VKVYLNWEKKKQPVLDVEHEKHMHILRYDYYTNGGKVFNYILLNVKYNVACPTRVETPFLSRSASS